MKHLKLFENFTPEPPDLGPPSAESEEYMKSLDYKEYSEFLNAEDVLPDMITTISGTKYRVVLIQRVDTMTQDDWMNFKALDRFKEWPATLEEYKKSITFTDNPEQYFIALENVNDLEDTDVAIYGFRVQVPVTEYWRHSKKLNDTNKQIGVMESKFVAANKSRIIY